MIKNERKGMNHFVLPRKLTLLFSIVLLQTLFTSNESYGQDVRKIPVGYALLDIEISRYDPTNLYACDYTGLYRSNDSGENWVQVFSGYNFHEIELNPKNPKIIYALNYSYTMTDYIEVSEDGGKTWNERGSSLFIDFVKVSPNSPYPLYSTPDSFAVSYDHGKSWRAIKTPFGWPSTICLLEGEDSTIYAGDFSKGVWLTRDNGETWDSLGMGGYRISSIALSAKDQNAIYVGTESRGLFKTLDGGVTWSKQKGTFRGNRVTRIVVNTTNPSQIFVATADSGLFITANSGDDWQRLEGIPKDANIAALAFDENSGRLFFSVLYEPYVYIVDSLFTAGEDKNSSVPIDFQLFQNYPNPFNSETWVRYNLHDKEKAAIAIYNLSGRKVRTLIKDEQLPGIHRVKWDGRDDRGRKVSSGVYVYQMRAGGKSIARKLLLVR